MDSSNSSTSTTHNTIEPELYKGFRLNHHVVLPEQGVVVREGRHIHISTKSMEILLYLTQQRNTVVSAEELLFHAWGDTTIKRGTLSHAISELRHALGDHKECPEFIQTLPRKGYRLISECEKLDANLAFPNIWKHPVTAHHATLTHNSKSRWHLSWAVFRSSKLFSVSVAFALSTWVLIQVLDVLFPIFNIPDCIKIRVSWIIYLIQ